MAQPNVITYAYIRGRWYAFPNPNSAYQGVTKYNGNQNSLRYSRPIGVLIDDNTLAGDSSYWPDTVADAQGVTGAALTDPQVNPIYGSSTINIQTPDTNIPAGNGGGGGGGDPHSGGHGKSYGPPDPGPGGRRSTGLYIKGTKILQSEVNANLRANKGDAQYWEERLANTDQPNDVLFEMAFSMGNVVTDSGQGNPFVGKVQSGQYKMDQGNTWAQDHRTGSGATDVYIQRDASGDPTGVTHGTEWADQFKHGNWEPGDFSKTARTKSDAAAWKTKHDLAAQGSLSGDALEAQKTRIRNRYNAMLGN